MLDFDGAGVADTRLDRDKFKKKADIEEVRRTVRSAFTDGAGTSQRRVNMNEHSVAVDFPGDNSRIDIVRNAVQSQKKADARRKQLLFILVAAVALVLCLFAIAYRVRVLNDRVLDYGDLSDISPPFVLDNVG